MDYYIEYETNHTHRKRSPLSLGEGIMGCDRIIIPFEIMYLFRRSGRHLPHRSSIFLRPAEYKSSGMREVILCYLLYRVGGVSGGVFVKNIDRKKLFFSKRKMTS